MKPNSNKVILEIIRKLNLRILFLTSCLDVQY